MNIKIKQRERGFVPMLLERDLFIKRVKAGGQHGKLLADAFLSAYRTELPFNHSLGELIHLDAEGLRLFFEILCIRHIPKWNDLDLFDIEYDIKIIMGAYGGR